MRRRARKKPKPKKPNPRPRRRAPSPRSKSRTSPAPPRKAAPNGSAVSTANAKGGPTPAPAWATPENPSVASSVRCRRLRAAIGAQRKAYRLPIQSGLASDATPRCASMASADRQKIVDATLAPKRLPTPPARQDAHILADPLQAMKIQCLRLCRQRLQLRHAQALPDQFRRQVHQQFIDQPLAQ